MDRCRTGDAPGVLFSAALTFGGKHNNRMYELYRQRGY